MLASFIHYFCIILFSILSPATEGRTTATMFSQKTPSRLAPALYVFGDSLVENGNNNALVTVAKGNYTPYGVDFPEGVTGRFTNGKTIADLISEELGLPFSPPFKGESPPADWLTGFNYASSACGILNESGSLLGQCYDLDTQIQMFENTIEGVLKKYYTNERDLTRHLSKSVVLFVIGNNDYLNNYITPGYIKYKDLTPKQFAKLLVNRLSQQLKKVYELGARKVLFTEIAPAGCMPFINKTILHKGPCDENLNKIISIYNKMIGKLLPTLQSTLPKSLFVVAKFNKLIRVIVNNHVKYGFENSKDPCCKAILDGALSCIPGTTPCENHNSYVFWDAFHPTETMASLIISRCFRDSSVCAPLNLRQLTQA